MAWVTRSSTSTTDPGLGVWRPREPTNSARPDQPNTPSRQLLSEYAALGLAHPKHPMQRQNRRSGTHPPPFGPLAIRRTRPPPRSYTQHPSGLEPRRATLYLWIMAVHEQQKGDRQRAAPTHSPAERTHANWDTATPCQGVAAEGEVGPYAATSKYRNRFVFSSSSNLDVASREFEPAAGRKAFQVTGSSTLNSARTNGCSRRADCSRSANNFRTGTLGYC